MNVLEYCKQNTDLEITDLFKFLFQSCFGCGHLVSDPETALERIIAEADESDKDNLPEVEYLDGEFCRVHLKALKDREGLEKLCNAFVGSSAAPNGGMVRFESELGKLMLYAGNKDIPFTEADIAAAIKEWRMQGFPAVSHSVGFRTAHHPAYRVIRKEYLQSLLPEYIK